MRGESLMQVTLPMKISKLSHGSEMLPHTETTCTLVINGQNSDADKTAEITNSAR